jgi:hypothetical protein
VLPTDLATVVVTGTFTDCQGRPLAGKVAFTPSSELQDPTGRVIIPAAPKSYRLYSGSFTADLAATDNADLVPVGAASWAYQVLVDIGGVPPWSFSTLLPHAPSSVDLSALIAA